MPYIKALRIITVAVLVVLLALVLAAPSQQAFSQSPPLRIGFMGDSSMDEYRGTDNRGNTFNWPAVTYNWIEQLVLSRSVDVGPWGDYPEPRRTGYAYNWSRTAANSVTLLSQGQHTGLAAQVANGQIDLVIMAIGGNDFAPWAGGAYDSIYNGTLSGTALQNKIDSVVNNITTAVDTILAARTIPMIVTTVGDFEMSPQIVTSPNYSDVNKRKRVSDTIKAVNDGIIAMAAARGLMVFDINAYGMAVVFSHTTNGNLVLDGVNITLTTAGDDPHNLILGDHIHGGTVLEGVIANGYLAEVNDLVDPDIPLFTNQEILARAGLVAQPNTAPVARADSVSANANTPLNIAYSSLLANDTDVNNDTLNISQFTQPAHGTLAFAPTGLLYTPANGYSGADSFVYTVDDKHGGKATATVSITVNPPAANRPPTANNDTLTTAQDTAAPLTYVSLLSNDTDPDSDPLTVTSYGTALHGTITSNPTGLVYTPTTGYSGTDSFTYTISDGRGGTASASVNVTITAQNRAPSAMDFFFSTNQDAAGSITYASLLANDSDPDNDPLAVTSYGTAAHGGVTSNAAGLVYTPNSGYSGGDAFTYTISDGRGGTATASVVVTVTPVNHPPSAANDSLIVNQDAAATISYVTLLTNDSDPDNDPLSVTSFSAASHGTVTSNATGLNYAPTTGYSGPDSFTYTISDGRGGTASALVNVTVIAVNHLPVAVDDSLTTMQEISGTIAYISLLSNDSDPDNDTLTVIQHGSASHGLVTDYAAGLIYTPASGYSGSDSFTYTIGDGRGGEATATVNVTVTPAPPQNHTPSAVNDVLTTAQDTPASIAYTTLLSNDSDPDNDALTVTNYSTAPHGTVTNDATNLIYTPTAGYSGSDSFTYTISDGRGGEATATVNVTVTPAPPQNHAPSAGNDALTTAQDTPASITYTTLLSNDSDPDNDALTVTNYSTASHGTVTNDATNLIYTPTAGYSGSDSFTYTIGDGRGGEATATVNVTVTPAPPQNHAPTAVNDSLTTAQDTPASIAYTTLLSNDSDPDNDALTVISYNTASHGTVTNDATNLIYTPTAGYSGSDSFTYTISDGRGGQATAIVNVTVTPAPPQNHAPTAVNDALTTAQDTPASIAYTTLLSNDSDPDNDSLTVVSYSTASHGTVTNDAAGLIYTPASGYSGSDSFTYTIGDGRGGEATATVNVTVTPAPPQNHAPSAVNDSLTTAQDTPASIAYTALLSNDSDPDNDTLTVTNYSAASHGTVTNDAAGLIYTPTAGYSGSDSFTYTIGDGRGGEATATVNVTVTPAPPQNHAPSATNDAYTTNEDTPLNVSAASGVLSNDSDQDGNPITASVVTQPTKGTLTLNADGSFTYTPNANLNGSDSFTYLVSDGQLTSNTATVSLTINPVNDAPAASNDNYTTNEDTVLTTTPANSVLLNDSDIEGSSLTASVVTQPTKGTLTLNANGTFIYTPNLNANGSDSFTYTASDGQAASNVATVTITITPVNDAPTATNDGFTTNEDTVLTTTLTNGVLANDTDVDGDTLTASVVTLPTKGTLTLNSNGTFAYTPNANLNGSDSFTYTINDGHVGSNTATVSLTINPVNDAPVAVNNTYTTNEDTVLTTTIANGVLANDSDIEGSALTAAVVTLPTKGTLTLNANGSFTYTPTLNANGSDSFTYTASDGQAVSNVATVSLTISPVNDAPVAVNDSYSTNSGTALTTTTANGVLLNDTDVDGNLLTAAVVTQPTKGTLTLNSNGSFTYTPNASATGSDTFTYRANDGTANSNTATVTITIVQVNRAPVAVNNSYTTNEDTVLTTTAATGVLTNDTDADGNTLTAAVVTQPAKGTLTLNANGSFTYTPTLNANGSDSFTYRASDGQLTSNTATVTLTITAVNDAPVAVNDAYTATAGVALTTTTANGVLLNDTDVEGSTLTAAVVTQPTKGTLTLNSNGSFTYTPTASATGTDTFTYRANDGTTNSNNATVTITINANTAQTLTVQINNGNDDVYEDGSTFTPGGSTVWIGSGSNPATTYTGLRFNNVTIPRGATITSVRLEIYSPSTQWIQMNLQYAGQLIPNSPAFSASSRPSQRGLTVARVTSNTNEQWLTNTWYNVQGLQSIIQEIVNQSGWTSGNSLAIIIRTTGTATWARKSARSYEGGATFAMRLVITYSS